MVKKNVDDCKFLKNQWDTVKILEGKWFVTVQKETKIEFFLHNADKENTSNFKLQSKAIIRYWNRMCIDSKVKKNMNLKVKISKKNEIERNVTEPISWLLDCLIREINTNQ